jgi:excinuclease ABC subunit B
MQKVIDETNRRRIRQEQYNKDHNITPQTIYKSIDEVLISTTVADAKTQHVVREKREYTYKSPLEREELLEQLQYEMEKAAKELSFERAAELRDEIARIKKERIKYNFGR